MIEYIRIREREDAIIYSAWYDAIVCVLIQVLIQLNMYYTNLYTPS